MRKSVTCINVASCTRRRLNSVMFMSVPAINRALRTNRMFNAVRMIGAVSSLFLPITNRIVRLGRTLRRGPRLIGGSPCNRN